VKLNKFIYFLTPPIAYRVFTKLKNRLLTHGVKSSSDQVLGDADLLKNFKREKFNLFFKEEVIGEFCDLMHQNFNENPPIPTQNKSNQIYLDELVENGFCKIEGLFSREQVKVWHDAIYPSLSAEIPMFHKLASEHGIASGKDINLIKDNKKHCYDLRSGIIRKWAMDVGNLSIQGLKNNKNINDICNSYLSGKAGESGVYADFKGIPLCKDANLLLHADSMFKQIKVFVLLNDVGLDQAPFIYYKKSHRLREWRLLKDFLAFTNYNRKYNSAYAQWGDIEMGRFAEAYPELAELESVVTGKAGDVIIADTRGVHGGSILKSGYRLQLGMSFSMLGDFHSGYLPKRILDLSRNV